MQVDVGGVGRGQECGIEQAEIAPLRDGHAGHRRRDAETGELKELLHGAAHVDLRADAVAHVGLRDHGNRRSGLRQELPHVNGAGERMTGEPGHLQDDGGRRSRLRRRGGRSSGEIDVDGIRGAPEGMGEAEHVVRRRGDVHPRSVPAAEIGEAVPAHLREGMLRSQARVRRILRRSRVDVVERRTADVDRAAVEVARRRSGESDVVQIARLASGSDGQRRGTAARRSDGRIGERPQPVSSRNRHHDVLLDDAGDDRLGERIILQIASREAELVDGEAEARGDHVGRRRLHRRTEEGPVDVADEDGAAGGYLRNDETITGAGSDAEQVGEPRADFARALLPVRERGHHREIEADLAEERIDSTDLVAAAQRAALIRRVSGDQGHRGPVQVTLPADDDRGRTEDRGPKAARVVEVVDDARIVEVAERDVGDDLALPRELVELAVDLVEGGGRVSSGRVEKALGARGEREVRGNARSGGRLLAAGDRERLHGAGGDCDGDRLAAGDPEIGRRVRHGGRLEERSQRLPD